MTAKKPAKKVRKKVEPEIPVIREDDGSVFPDPAAPRCPRCGNVMPTGATECPSCTAHVTPVDPPEQS